LATPAREGAGAPLVAFISQRPSTRGARECFSRVASATVESRFGCGGRFNRR
jgi:hypothetical protein